MKAEIFAWYRSQNLHINLHSFTLHKTSVFSYMQLRSDAWHSKSSSGSRTVSQQIAVHNATKGLRCAVASCAAGRRRELQLKPTPHEHRICRPVITFALLPSSANGKERVLEALPQDWPTVDGGIDVLRPAERLGKAVGDGEAMFPLPRLEARRILLLILFHARSECVGHDQYH